MHTSNEIIREIPVGKFRVFDSFVNSGHISGSTGRDIFLRRKAPLDRLRCELPRGLWGHAPPGEVYYGICASSEHGV